jgi:anti-sigma factor RsiW
MDRPRAPEAEGRDRLLLHALADGELDAAAALALEGRMMAEPALAADYARIVALREAMQRLDRPPVGAAFRARIAALAPPAATEAPARRTLRLPADWRPLAAVALVAAVLAGGATYMAIGPAVLAVEDAVAGSHLRSLLAASPVDIASSDRHTVKPWLDARLGVSPPAVDLAAQGFPLIGARVDVVGGRAVPSLVYRYGNHLITLLAVPTSAGAATAAVPESLAAGGYAMMHWQTDGFSYWAASDLDPAQLDRFVSSFRSD